MKVNLQGKIRNTQLPLSRALLPMFEAVVNSFQAIEDRTPRDAKPYIEVVVERETVLPGGGFVGKVTGFTITDNGVGFTDDNVESFITSDSQYKVNRGGKGIGRFIWLKAFSSAQIESTYIENGVPSKRVFTFTTNDEQETVDPETLDKVEFRTTVRLIGMRKQYRDNCPSGLSTIGNRLVEHCLPFFLDPKCSTVILRDATEEINLNHRFQETFSAAATKHTFKVGDETFKLRGLRFHNPHETRHRLIYAANLREVLEEKLDKFLPNLKTRLTDEKGYFAYLGFIEGQYLDQNVNGERTNFSFPLDASEDELTKEIDLQTIRNGAIGCISQDLEPLLKEINEEKREKITTYIAQEAPQYRPLVRYMDEFIEKIPPGASARALDTILHEQIYEKDRDLRQVGHQLIQESAQASLKPEEYRARLNDFIVRENELGKSSLAKYVAHRRVILEFLEKSIHATSGTTKYPLESVVHNLIYPMRTTSDDVPYEQQNLWIIDERLAYHWFLTSDLPLAHQASPLESNDDVRPDLMIFERALSFAQDEAPLTSLVVIEFKQPERQSYKEDPVDQVYRLIRKIREGHFKDKNGNEIKLQGPAVPAYAYIICDTTRAIVECAENKGMTPTPDNLGYFVYNPSLSTYVEIITYKKLLRDAKRRNRILFDKLHIPLTQM